MDVEPEQPRKGAGSSSRHHHKHKQKKDKHKHKDKSKRREALERNKEVGSDVESGEILGDGADGPCLEPKAQRALTQPEHLQGGLDNTDVSTVHRAAGELPEAADDQGTARRTRSEPPEAGSNPVVETQEQKHYPGMRKRERAEVGHEASPGDTVVNSQDVAPRSRKEARREPEPGEARDDEVPRVPSLRADAERLREKEQGKHREREREREHRRQDADAREYERQRERERTREEPGGGSRDDRRDGRDRKDRSDRERYRERDRDRGREKEKDREERSGMARERSHRRDGSEGRPSWRASRERSRSPRPRQREEGGRARSPSRSPMGRGVDRKAVGDRRERERRDSARDRGGTSGRDEGRRNERDDDNAARDTAQTAGRGRSSPQARSPEAIMTLEDEEDEEARIEREREERKRRQQAILQRHAQQQALTETAIAPTATALAAVASGGLDSAAAASGQGGQLPAPRSPSVMRTTLEPLESLRHVPSASVLTRSAPGTPGWAAATEGAGEADGCCDGEGDRTPEGERISSSDSSGGLDAGGPVLDIFGQLTVADDADSGVAVVAGEGVTAEDAELERHRKAAALMQQLQPIREPGASTDLARVVGRGGGAHGVTRRSIGVTRAPAGPVDAPAAETGDVDMDAGGIGGGGDDDDDMFAELKEEDAGQGVAAARAAPAGGAAQLHDSYDDPEGYYNFQIGEVLDNRYEVTEFKGKGVFSTVMRARDHGVGRGVTAAGAAPSSGAPEVAIKVIRANETMYKAAQTEQAILRKLCSSDPENRKHCIRLLRAFEFRKHMCLVFEPMDMNLRDLTKKYGRNKGLNVTAVGMYTAQLLVALRHLRKNGVLHADIKPDNILVNARRTKVKLCDFGSAMLAGENELTPYLVSRFYRAPEVILGMKYDYAMDMWSVGCVVYELFTGNILFPGRTNNEMVKLMMDVKGPFTKKMLRRCLFADKHFDMDEPNTPFIYMEEDTLTKKPVRRMITVQAAKNNFAQLLAPALRSAKTEDKPQIQLLVDLLDKMMMLEPEKRIDTDAAMRHPFVRSFLPKKHEHGHAHGHPPRPGQREGSVPL
ncbi:hypothetical protein VaNZ11_006603 [Volvox africanus]|uniref:non-specific serine/threonine protein kinase n=1 Tax=Volvox africanus TaxID=51714 RepID=A0ABQ5S143_9CHLO|nr:hypothetical protein VaNZ11_006603 [Volvox africanus]